MSQRETKQESGTPWTNQESKEFSERLRKFREELSAPQRKVFDRVIAGAAEAIRFGKKVGAIDRDHAPFSQKLAAFRDGLPPKQRDALASILMAGAVAWGAAKDGQG